MLSSRFPLLFNMKVAVVVLFLTLLTSLAQTKEIGIYRYGGYQVLRVLATGKAQFEILKVLIKNDDLDFWTNPKVNAVTDIMVGPEHIGVLTELLDTHDITWTVKIQDVGQLIEEERLENKNLRIRRHTTGSTKMAWNVYERFDTIETFIKALDANGVATLSIIGRSSEDRPLYQVKVSTGLGSDEKPKPVVFIESNLHAREWIAGATGTWILNELATKSTEPDYAELLDAFDFYFVPMANPDGYEYSHTTVICVSNDSLNFAFNADTRNRLWLKTRSVNAGSTCRGCNPNLNWSFHFGELSVSSEYNPCSDLYTGANPFSEPETKAISDSIKKIQAETTVHAYYTLHAYGQVWLLPWGYAQGEYPEDFADLLRWGRASVAAVESVHGRKYETGQGADIFEGGGGSSYDWVKSEGVKYSTTIELRGDSFILNPDEIIPTAQETLAGIRLGLLDTIKNKKFGSQL